MQNNKHTFLFLILSLWVLFSNDAHSQDVGSATGPHITVEFVSEFQELKPGDENWVGVLLSPDPQWHTYWLNPGDSGEPPVINLSSDANLSFGEIQWPLPERIPVAHLVNFGYNGANLLMIPVTVDETFENLAQVTITADLSWLVCKEDCIPGWATLSRTFPISTNSTATEHKSLFDDTRATLPEQTLVDAVYETTSDFLTLAFANDALISKSSSDWQIFPERGDLIQHNAEQISVDTGEQIVFTLPLSDYYSESSEDIRLLVSNGDTGYYVNASINMTRPLDENNLAYFMLLAFLGGLILNLMPCVLPVISIKALSFQSLHNGVSYKLGYPIGVLVSFLVFALIVIAIQKTGTAVGWGFHMQEPIVVGGLAFLFMFIALMLLDIAPTGSGLAGIGNSLTSGSGFSSQFFTGALAAIVASPCTAPFMATAMGVAFVSSTLTTIMIFVALGVGFALPVSLLYWLPSLSKRMPKPGAWMNTFRQFLVFPMIGTVMWLVWVFSAQSNHVALLGLMFALLAFSLCIWAYSLVSSKLRFIWLGLAVVTVYVPFTLHSDQLETVASPQSNSMPFNTSQLQNLRESGKTVLVNMTADWCITCKVNEQVAFKDQQVMSMLNSDNVVYMVGDWTNKNQDILGFLNQYERSGVPLYVIYQGLEYEQVLPQILTPSLLIDAIEYAQEQKKQ